MKGGNHSSAEACEATRSGARPLAGASGFGSGARPLAGAGGFGRCFRIAPSTRSFCLCARACSRTYVRSRARTSYVRAYVRTYVRIYSPCSARVRTYVRAHVRLCYLPVALPLSLRARARAHARELYVRMRALRARRKREIWCPLAMHVRAYARTYTYVRTPSPSPSRCARTHARMRASCTYVCVRSQPGERERYGALSPCTYARARVRTDVYVRTYVCLSGSRDAPPSPEGDPVSVLSTKFLRTYVRIQPTLAHWDGLSVRIWHCACHVRGAFRQALGGFNSGAAQ